MDSRKIRSKARVWIIYIIVITMIIDNVTALPEILDIFNTNYNTAGTRLDTCDTCHIPGLLQNETNLNPYGVGVKGNLNIEINNTLAVIEPLDSDGDWLTNIEEIRSLTFPGNKSDFQRVNIVPSPTLLSEINNTDNIENIENNATIAITANSTSIVTTTVPRVVAQKIPGFGIFASILSMIFIFGKYRNCLQRKEHRS